MTEPRTPSETTEPQVEILCVVRSTCPDCGKTLEQKRKLSEVQLTTGNAAAKATYHLDEMKAEIRAAMKKRGWNVARCGACQDQDGHTLGPQPTPIEGTGHV